MNRIASAAFTSLDTPGMGEQPAPPSDHNIHPPNVELGFNPEPTPRQLHEEQMQFMSLILDKEVSNHNQTRERLHRYLNLYMKQERDGCAEREELKYLKAVNHNLRDQVKEEKDKRLAAEEQNAALLLESFNHYQQVGPALVTMYKRLMLLKG